MLRPICYRSLVLHRAARNSDVGVAELCRHVDEILGAILEVNRDSSNDEFRHQLSRGLAEALGCHTAFVGELTRLGDSDRVRTLAVWSHGKRAKNFEYPLSGSPCEEAIRTGILRVDKGVAGLFPNDPMLGEIHAESYLGAAIRRRGETVGHLAALDDRPIADQHTSEIILKIFASRAAAYLDGRFFEGRMQDAQDNFRILFERSPNAIVLFDPETWKPIEFNDLAAEFMGYTREEFADLTITDLEEVPNAQQTTEHISKIAESGGDVFEAVHRAKDGSSRHVIVSLRMMGWEGRQVMLTLWHDITARKAAEQAHQASERRLQSLFDTAMDAVVIVDENRRITHLNLAAERIFECRASDVGGSPVDDFFPKSILDRLFSRVQSDSGGAIWAPLGLNALRKGGEVFPVDLTVSAFEVDGSSFFTLILRDVNDRHKAEVELRRLQDEKMLLQEQLSENTTFIGESPTVAAVLSHAEKVAATDSTVLILGETGTGKELIARAIHDLSVRCDRVMVTVNCAALPKELLESELFGHEKGAFTGATQRKRGRFELASGGTLFLDEVAELSLEAQAKLLRALQEGEIQRVGGESTVRVNVRTIAATHRDLEQGVEEGWFRSDLYYRLSVFPLRIPPLRERGSDVSLLVDHFVSVYSRRFGKPLSGFEAADLGQLVAYHWPGNVRELQNVVERAAILSSAGTLELDAGLLRNLAEGGSDATDDLDETTRRHVSRVLTECNWVIEGPRGAALRLGIKPSTLRFRMQKLGIEKP